jgi:hypothetical protein
MNSLHDRTPTMTHAAARPQHTCSQLAYRRDSSSNIAATTFRFTYCGQWMDARQAHTVSSTAYTARLAALVRCPLDITANPQ